MSRSTAGRAMPGLLAAAAVALLGVALWWLLDDGPGRGAAGLPSALTAPQADAARPAFADPARDAQAIDPAALAADAAAASSDAAGAPAADGAARALLTGRITRQADGKPAAGVPVYALIDTYGPRTRPPLDEAASQPVTDADGRYRLSFMRACTVTQLRASPGPLTVRAGLDARLDLVPGTEATLDMQVGSGGAISGLVVDTRGQPVPGASVSGWADASINNFENRYEPDRTTQADGAGEFLLEHMGVSFLVTAGAPGFVVHDELVGTLAEGARLGSRAGGPPITPPLTVVLARQREIRGLVLGPDGAPVARAHVQAIAPEADVTERLTALPDVFHERWSLSERRTDKDGRLLLAPVADETLSVFVLADDLLPWSGRHAPGDPDLLVHLQAGLVLTGTVTDAESGAPVEALVHVIGVDESNGSSTYRTGSSDSDGRFSIAGLVPTRTAELDVEAAQHAIFVRVPIALTGPGPQREDIVLAPERVLAGLVVDAAGAPVAGARIEIEGDRRASLGGSAQPSGTWESRFSLDQAATDAQGRFRIGQLYDGLFTLTATDPLDEQLTARAEARSGSENLRLQLKPGASEGVTLLVLATDELTGRPIARYDISPLFAAGNGFTGETRHVESEDGRCRIAGLPAGELQIMAQAPGYTWLSQRMHCEVGEHAVELRFTEARSVLLRVLDELRRPVAARLSFRGAGGEALMVGAGPGSTISSLETDARGEAQVHGLPAALVVVTVKRDVHGSGQDFPLDLRPPPAGPVELVLGGATEAMLFWVVVCAPSGWQEPGAGAPASGLIDGIEKQLADGTLWLLDTEGRVLATDAEGAVKAEAKLLPAAQAAAAKPTPEAPTVATRKFIGALKVPAVPLRITVEADGYVPVTRAFDPAAGAGTLRPQVFYLRRP